ncbi:MAG: hypothetical protein ACI360_08580 [Atopobiaceae bacterium]
MADSGTTTTATTEDLEHINPGYVTTGSPVSGACAWVNYDLSTDISKIDASNYLTTIKASSSWHNLGELSSDGIVRSNSTTSNDFKGWHGTNLLSKVSEESNTVKVTLVETQRPAVKKLRYGDEAVTVDSSTGKVKEVAPTKVPTRMAILMFAELLDTGDLELTIYPRAAIKSVEDETDTSGDLRGYGVTFAANNDSDGHPYYQRYGTAA